ncbi:hypothetical protein BD779DRAFT_1673361 [Infundibulicybe gibba]|nr:hypothetical protein BD779DRAFT_1673361 [Infundibulicybe gibba]
MPGPANKQKAPKKKASAIVPPTPTIPEPGPPHLEIDHSWPELQDYPEVVAMLESLSPSTLQYVARKAYQTGYDAGFDTGFDHHMMETDAQAYRRLKSKGVWAEMEQAERAHASTQTETPIAIRVREASSQATPATQDAASQANPTTHSAASQANPVRCDAMSQTPSKATTHDPQRLTKRIGPTPLRQTEPNAGEMASRTSVAPLAPPDTQPPPTAARGTVFEPHKPLATHSVASGAPPQTTIFAHEPVQTAAMAGKIPSQTEQRARDASYHATVALVSPQSSPDPIKGSTSWADEVELALPSIGVTPQPTPSARDFSALRSSKPDPFRALRRRTRRRRRQPCPLTSTLSSRNLGPTTPGTQNRTRDVEPISRPPGLRPTSPGMRDFRHRMQATPISPEPQDGTHGGAGRGTPASPRRETRTTRTQSGSGGPSDSRPSRER